VLAGIRRPREAAQVLGTSLPRYYQLEQRALAGLVSACEPAPRGPRQDASRRVARLEREKQRLQRDCDRQQALVRMAQRSLGLLPPASAKSSGNKPADKESPATCERPEAKRRRNRRPSVRALRAAKALIKEVASEADAATPELTLASANR